jgi:hypothetical protein
MKSKNPRRTLIDKVDRAFNRTIKQKHANAGGWVECCTCGIAMHWQEADAGHFIKCQHMAVRWDERNVHPQCQQCNHWKGGAQDEYARFIIKKYGIETFDELMTLKRTTRKYTMAELRELLEQYQ